MNVWAQYVAPCKNLEVYVIAHSAGGGCVTAIQTKFAETFYTQVKQVAYTDSFVIGFSRLTPD